MENKVDPTKPLSDPQEDKQINNSSDKPWLFQPGQSGNPKGRPPKGYSITECFQNMLGGSLEKKEALVQRIYLSALNGDMNAAKMIWNYMDGMPAQATDITSMGEKMEGIKTVILDTRPKEVNP